VESVFTKDENKHDTTNDVKSDIRASTHHRLFSGLIDIRSNEAAARRAIHNIESNPDIFRTDLWLLLNGSIEKSDEQEDVMVDPSIADEVSAYVENAEYIRRSTFFRPSNSKNALRFFREIENILLLHCEKGMSLDNICQLIDYNPRLLRRQLKYYFVKSLPKFRKYKAKQRVKNSNDKKMSKRIDDYIISRSGECTTIKMIHDYLIANPEDLIPASINYSNIKMLLKEHLQYSWVQSQHRDPKSIDPRNKVRRELFLKLRDALHHLGYGFIYIDEASFSPQGISTYTWQKKDVKTKLLRSPDRDVNTIAAWICKGKYAFMLKKGSTKEHHMVRFFELLDEMLVGWFGADYRKSTIFVLDNACVHTSSKVVNYIFHKDLSAITLPPYTPEFNPIERVFHNVKKRLKLMSGYKKRIEYNIAKVIQEL
jgi:hypothetical protein